MVLRRARGCVNKVLGSKIAGQAADESVNLQYSTTPGHDHCNTEPGPLFTGRRCCSQHLRQTVRKPSINLAAMDRVFERDVPSRGFVGIPKVLLHCAIAYHPAAACSRG